MHTEVANHLMIHMGVACLDHLMTSMADPDPWSIMDAGLSHPMTLTIHLIHMRPAGTVMRDVSLPSVLPGNYPMNNRIISPEQKKLTGQTLYPRYAYNTLSFCKTYILSGIYKIDC